MCLLLKTRLSDGSCCTPQYVYEWPLWLQPHPQNQFSLCSVNKAKRLLKELQGQTAAAEAAMKLKRLLKSRPCGTSSLRVSELRAAGQTALCTASWPILRAWPTCPPAYIAEFALLQTFGNASRCPVGLLPSDSTKIRLRSCLAASCEGGAQPDT